MANLSSKKVAVLAADGFEQSELDSPVSRLRKEGAQVDIISLKSGKIRGMTQHEWDKEVSVDKTVDAVSSADYDGLVLPGGVLNPDALRSNTEAVQFVKSFFEEGKPVAAICHGPQTLIDAEVVKGKKMTSFKAIKKDLQNAGAQWVDEEVVVDHGLVTSRGPKDLPAFEDAMVKQLK